MNKSKSLFTDPLIVGVSGGSGSGKTTICREVLRYCPEDIVLVDQDSYYKDLGQLSRAKRESFNYDHPDAFDNNLLSRHLQTLKQCASVEVPEYDFVNHSRTGNVRVVHAARVILVEGIMLFAVPEVRNSFDRLVYVHVEADIRFIRRLRRDIKARGRNVDSVVRQYLESVKPMHNKYVRPHRENSDLIINGLNLKRSVRQLSEFIAAIKEENHESENFHNYTILQPGAVFGINYHQRSGPELSKS